MCLDGLYLSSLFLWFILGATSESDASRALLAVSAIPLSLSLLQYLSMYRPLGQIVIMIFTMSKDVMYVRTHISLYYYFINYN